MNLDDQIAGEIARAALRISQRQKAQLMKEARTAALSKERARKAERRRRFELGGAVIAAGMGDWDMREVTGLLLDGKSRVEHSTTLRLALRKRAATPDANRPDLMPH